MKPLTVGLRVLLCGSLVAAFPQDPSRVPVYREQTRERILAARISSPQQRAPVKQVNVAQLRHNAEELAQVEQTVQAEIRAAERAPFQEISAKRKPEEDPETLQAAARRTLLMAIAGPPKKRPPDQSGP